MTLVVLIGVYLTWSIIRRPNASPGYLVGTALLFLSPSVLSIDYQPVGYFLLVLGAVLAIGLGAASIGRGVAVVLFLLLALHGLLPAIRLIVEGYATSSSILQLALTLMMEVPRHPG